MSGPGGAVAIYTVGHSTRSGDAFSALLEREDIRVVADVRAFPGSRRYPHFNREVLRASLAEAGIDYHHLPALGGRRKPTAGGPATRWRNDAFRGYAEYMRSDAFRDAVLELLELARGRRTAVMCAEAVPWRCHRSLIADALLAHGVEVLHILDGGARPHAMTPFAVVARGVVRYDGDGAIAAVDG